MIDTPLVLLGGLTPNEFLKEYWQKKPYLIRGAISNVSPTVTLNDLLALASNNTVESRFVFEKDGEYPWQVVYGPLTNLEDLELPKTHWTLLVQAVDQRIDSAASLLEQFNFIPNWRVDDLMISYAPEGGSVGPHIDSYDVFLLQVEGKRQWLINTKDYNEEDFIPDLDLRIIHNFKATQEWTLEPGDMLYLPPGIAHHGIAVDECMTYSIGFRAPDKNELLTYFIEDLLENSSNVKYADPELTVQTYPGEISQHSVEQLRSLIKTPFNDDKALDIWLGCYLTRHPDGYNEDNDELVLTPDEVLSLLARKGEFKKVSAYRTAFISYEDEFVLFVDGMHYILPGSCADVIHELTGSSSISYNTIKQVENDDFTYVLTTLYNHGIFHDE